MLILVEEEKRRRGDYNFPLFSLFLLFPSSAFIAATVATD
jgi:hypothetical protein